VTNQAATDQPACDRGLHAAIPLMHTQPSIALRARLKPAASSDKACCPVSAGWGA
jgi:hypothetical protein